MSIRVKLALILAAAIAAASAAAGLVFVKLDRAALREAEAGKVRLLVESVRRVGEESLLADDPLMLLDYLAFLRKDRPEVHHCRALLEGKWRESGGQAPPEPAGGVEVKVAEASHAGKSVRVEILFSKSVLEERERRAFGAVLRNVARSGLITAAGGLLLALLLSAALTRRIVLIEGALAAIGQGRLGESVRAEGRDEIARLARGVNEMSAKLQELDRMKKTFIASVTHELRSPLGAIESQVREMLLDPAARPAPDKESLERIRKSASRLEHFVANLLEMAKIERGKLEFSPKPCELGPIVEDAALFFAANAREAGISLEAEVEPGLGLFKLDADLLAHVLANLISNALKFTPKGGSIRVALRRSPGGPCVGPERRRDSARGEGPACRAECSVSDTGVGIPAEALGRIFSPFERVLNPVRASGAGLGLAISKSIVEMHGGTIRAESEPGKGSRFVFELKGLG
ncbi:MAG: HAMP domain-containing histidine kinase [Elusimicrobia bacterium]|nr:HAMP domain-containing histidine kinase [Elusimicrobiota bacterium]